MKRKRHNKVQAENFEVVRLWTHAQAKGALPYLRSIASSLREHWLEAQSKNLEADRLEKQPGRATKGTMLAVADARTSHQKAENCFQEALEEMLAMHVFPIDVNQGLALIPFRQKDELAWFVFDLFEPGGLRSWRFHNDPLETRRPITEVEESQTEGLAI